MNMLAKALDQQQPLTLFPDKEKQIIFGLPPSKSNSYFVVYSKKKDRTFLLKSEAVKKYEKQFDLQCIKYRNRNINTFFAIEIDVYYPNNRSDLDGASKIVMDCLQMVGAITNDNLCNRLVMNKFIDKSNPRIEFSIKPTTI